MEGTNRSEAAARGLTGRGPAVRELMRLVVRVAPLPLTVLIVGESGSGKEVVARELHARSPRRGRPLVALNCAAVPEALLESELFGHVRGAFTGADSERRGLVEEAEGSTLLLDEIGELPLTLQAKLLRFLQEREYRRVGCPRLRRAEVRIVAATHRDLAAQVAAGAFREDLYYRLRVVTLDVPPLRCRPEDLAPLVQELVQRHAGRLGLAGLTLGPRAWAVLRGYDWPGNIRELENELLRLLALVDPGRVVEPEDLSPMIRARVHQGSRAIEQPCSYRQALTEFSRRYVQQALRDHGGNRTRAARALGLSRQALVQKLKTLDLASAAPQ